MRPTYYVVVAENWVHAYQSEDDVLADDAIAQHHCGGLEFFDSDGHRYAPCIGAGLRVIGFERTADRPNPELVARRIRSALQRIKAHVEERPDEIRRRLGSLDLDRRHGAAGVLGDEPLHDHFHPESFEFSIDGRTLETAIKEQYSILGDASPHPGPKGHTDGTSWSHRLCHAVGAC